MNGSPATPGASRQDGPSAGHAPAAGDNPVAQWLSAPRTSEAIRPLLQQMRRALAGVSSSTEGVFLLVGGRLMELQGKAREIADRTASISELLANDDGSTAILEDLLAAARGGHRAEEMASRIREIQENAVSIRRAIDAIDPIANTFYVLGVTTRIETACFDAGATFIDLAEAVTALSHRIRKLIDDTADSAVALLERNEQAAETVHRVAQKHQQDLGPLARQTGAELAKIKEHRAQISEATKRLAARFSTVSRAVGDVVAALQSHDIVRQQIEHVLEALQRVDSLSGSDSNLLEVARLQAALLNNSRGTFEKSVGQIRAALERIELNIGEVADESAHLLGMSQSSDASFFSSLRSDLIAILGILESNAAADCQLAGSAESVHRRVSEISQNVLDVRTIGAKMQFIALNATIQAVRLGQNGAALKIVAQTIRELAQAAGETVDNLDGRLRAVRDASSALHEQTGASSEWEAQIAQLNRRIEALTSAQNQARTDFTRTFDLTAGLKQQIAETVAAFGTQQECLDVLGNATELLRQLSADATRADSSGLREMAEMYTMHSERAVHRAVYDIAAPGDDLVPAGVPAAQPDDNIEFF